jgi:hypothetical protein
MFSRKLILAAAAVFLIFGLTHNAWADHDDDDRGHGNGNGNDKKKESAEPVGSWFGIARACPANPVTDSPAHATFCTAVCGTCANSGLLPAEITIMPTLFEDGTLLADDAGQIGATGTAVNYHTTAHGQWTESDNDSLLDVPGRDRIKGTYLSLGSGVLFTNSVRTRFVTYFDPDDPDHMLGYFQPYLLSIAVGAQVVVLPANPANPLVGNHIPANDPLAALPAGCVLANGCLGTYHFVVRRIRAQ